MRKAAEKSLAQLDDHELAARCLEGHEAAWEALVHRYQRLVYSIALRHGFTEDAASDVFQSVWMRLLEHLPALNDRSKLASWLITTTTRECWRVSHKHRREAPIGEGGDEDVPAMPEVVDHRPLAEEEHLQLEQQQQLRQAVAALPDRCRELVTLLYYEEERPSYEEISRRLEMPVPSIGPTRARCLGKLRRIIEDGDRGD
mgnify:CR=1 FL=1